MTTTDTASRISDETLLVEVVDEFVERLERGERPEIDDYVRRYPAIAEMVRQVLPALGVLRTSSGASTASSSPTTEGEPSPAAAARSNACPRSSPPCTVAFP